MWSVAYQGAIPIMVWCVSGPGIRGKLQSLVCWCIIGQTMNVAVDGVTASGYGTEYAWQIRAVGYSPVSDEVIPSNAKNTSLACHVEMPAACVILPSTVSRFQHD